MKFYHLKQLSPEEYRLLLRRSETDITRHLNLAMEVIDRVRRKVTLPFSIIRRSLTVFL